MALDNDRRERLVEAAAADLKDAIEAMFEDRPATSDQVGELVESWLNEHEAALARVTALHTPAERPGMCPTCFVTAPCATVRAIDEVGGME